MPRKIILDCDPGHDDAIAMLLAHGSSEIDLLAVTTVAGNQTLAKVTRNALGVAAVAGMRGVTIAAGCDRPFVRPFIGAAQIHGESGLGGVELPDPAGLPEAGIGLDPRHGVDVIIETVMARDVGEITLVPIGPLTNIAMAARKEPRIVERVREVVLMGGGVHKGNRTPTAEFNILADPESAHVVFDAGWPVTMVGLDLTHQALATEEVCARIGEIGGPVAELVLAGVSSYGAAYRETGRFDHPPLHDPCAVAYVVDRAVMTTRRAPVSVELTGTHTLGMTVADLRDEAPADCRTQVALELDVDRFWDLVVEALAALGDGDGQVGEAGR